MALSDEGSNMVMPVAPAYGGNGGFGGGFGGDWGWIILLLLCGWGNGGFGGFGGGYGNMMLGYDFPWLLNGQNGINANTNSGFRDAMINDGIGNIQNSITSGFGDLQTSLCGGFAGVNASINGAQNAIASQLYGNQISSLERSFAAQTAMTQGMTGLQSQLSQCCCDNRLATCQTQNIVQNEGAATRLAIQNQTQQIIDKLCEQEIEQLRSANVALQNQVNMLNLSASQASQTAALIADNTAQTQYIVNRVAPYPIPAYTVANPVTPAT